MPQHGDQIGQRIERGAFFHGRHDAERKGEDDGDQQGDERQPDGVGEALLDQVQHGHLTFDRAAEIPLHRTLEEQPVLHRQRSIQPQRGA